MVREVIAYFGFIQDFDSWMMLEPGKMVRVMKHPKNHRWTSGRTGKVVTGISYTPYSSPPQVPFAMVRFDPLSTDDPTGVPADKMNQFEKRECPVRLSALASPLMQASSSGSHIKAAGPAEPPDSQISTPVAGPVAPGNQNPQPKQLFTGRTRWGYKSPTPAPAGRESPMKMVRGIGVAKILARRAASPGRIPVARPVSPSPTPNLNVKGQPGTLLSARNRRDSSTSAAKFPTTRRY